MTRLALVGAMHEEVAALLPLLEATTVVHRGGRAFHLGRLEGHDVIVVRSGIGKVAAATTAAVLLDAFEASAVLFTGVAGGLHPDVRVGDIVVGRSLLQHDMDASPLFPRHEVPLTGRSRFDADSTWAARLTRAAADVLGTPCAARSAFGLAAPALHEGLVVSGDRFVATSGESARLRADLPDAMAVEMEGAALAQVCHDFGRPFGVVRTISDRADDSAHVDFGRFVREVAAPYSRDIVRAVLRLVSFAR
jgi:adenosylhomocysteine nucleosidase